MTRQRMRRYRPRPWIGATGDALDRRIALADAVLTPDAQFELEGLGTIDSFVKAGDKKLPLVNLWCKHCQVIVGAIYAIEVHRRLPGHAPFLILETQHPTGEEAGSGQHPVAMHARTLLDTAQDQMADLLVAASHAELPSSLETYCRVHGALTFETAHATHRGHTAHHQILSAWADGLVPKMGRWKLEPAT